MGSLLAPPALSNEDSPVDVIFVIDGSQNMQWTDPSAFRKDAVKCFIDLIAEDVGAVAVTQFGGWSESKAAGETVFPLTALPKPGDSLNTVLELVKQSIDAKVKPFGQATDFNLALGEGLQPVLQDLARNPNRKAWIIVFTGAIAFEVSEGDQTRADYVAEAKAKGLEPSFENLNAVALDDFKTKTLPALNQENIFLTPILLQSKLDEKATTPIVDALVNEVHGPGKALRATKESLRSVFLEALASVPTTFMSSRATKAFDYKAEPAAPKAEVPMKFHRFPFATMTRAVIFSESPALEIDVVGPDGKSVRSSPHCRVVGAGARYRVVSVNKFMPPGDYTVKMVSGADAPVTVEHLWYATIDTRPKLEVPPESQPSAPIPYTASLLSPDGKVITDAAFLDGLECVLSYKKPNGETSPIASPRFGATEASAKDQLILGEDVPFGDYTLTAKFRALKRDDGAFAYESSAVSAKTTVRSKIDVTVTPSEAFEGQTAVVKVALSSRVAPKGLAVKMTDPKGKEHAIDLVREGMKPEMQGEISLHQPGDWKVTATTADPVKVNVATPVVKVGARKLTLFDDKGKELPKIVLPLKWEEDSEAEFKGKVKVDVQPGEAASFAATTLQPPADPKLGETKLNTAAGSQPGELGVAIAVHQREGEAWHVGPLTAAATVGTVKLAHEFPIELTYPDKAEKEFKKFIKTILMIAIPLLLLLLLLGVYLYMRPRFEKHCLVAIGQRNEKMAVHNIAQKLGLRGGSGPPESPGVLGLAAIGRRGKTRARLDALKTPLFLGGKPLTASTELKDGDRITFEKDGTSYMFLYFAGDPPADLSPYLPPLPKETGSVEDDEIVIEF